MSKAVRQLLLVEDSEELLELWLSLFRATNVFSAKGVATPSDAVHLVKNGYKPEILLTDYFLGEMDGLELVEKLRSFLPGLEVFVVTGNNDDENLITRARHMNAEVLYKPIKFRTLLQFLQKEL